MVESYVSIMVAYDSFNLFRKAKWFIVKNFKNDIIILVA